MSVEVVKILKISFTIKCTVAKDEFGNNVWRATSESLKLHADGQTPDSAVAELQKAIQNAESQNSRSVAKVFVPKVKKDAEIKDEEVTEKSGEEVAKEVQGEVKPVTANPGKTSKGKK